MGSPQVINCTVSTVSGVESSSVMIMWLDSEGNVIDDDGRVTISDTTSIGNNIYVSTLNFAYLMEGVYGDEGNYTCDVMILDASGNDSIDIESLIGQCVVNMEWAQGFKSTLKILPQIYLFMYTLHIMVSFKYFKHKVP